LSSINNLRASVIIVGYNGENYLKNAFDSLLNLDFPLDLYEIIYVDNKSSDNSLSIAKKYAANHDNIIIIANDKNIGFAAGNNVGIRRSRGENIFLFNQDAIAEKRVIKELIRAIEKDKQIGVVGAIVYYVNSHYTYFGGGKLYYGGFGWNWYLRNKEGECDFIAGCAMLITKEALNESGLMDEDLFAYYEDADLCSRIKKKGFKIYYTPKAIVWHDVPKKAKRPSKNIVYLMHRNRVIYCWKNYNHKRIFLLLDLLFLYNIFSFYELIRVPSEIRFIKEVFRARIDSLRYCLTASSKIVKMFLI
jgi:GT2 family glycosyltransferase